MNKSILKDTFLSICLIEDTSFTTASLFPPPDQQGYRGFVVYKIEIFVDFYI